MRKNLELIPAEIIENKIYLIRDTRVMLDLDLAKLYQVETRSLNQAVKRNSERFPSDFMFQLNMKEVNEISRSRSQSATLDVKMRSQIVTASKRNVRYLPYVFTEQGVAMLSSILKSKRAVQMSIAIVRAFIKLRELLATHKNLIVEFEKMKRTQEEHGQHIINILNVIKQLLNPPKPRVPKEPMGFRERKN